MYNIYEVLTRETKAKLFMLHFNTPEYKSQEIVYGYQIVGAIYAMGVK